MPINRKHITSILDPDLEAKDFIHGSRPASQSASRMASQPASQQNKRRKITIRIPKDLDEVLSQVWYERGQARTKGTLAEGQVFEKQDIITEALREWFEKRGYFPEKAS